MTASSCDTPMFGLPAGGGVILFVDVRNGSRRTPGTMCSASSRSEKSPSTYGATDAMTVFQSS
jgi:hypothetical protein